MRLRKTHTATIVLAVSTVLVQAQSTTEQYRPQYHFSPRAHWTNDPNGLVYFEGEYHLFFQYNPFGDNWGHMSWGHAVSRNLLHWEELPVALREENGVMIFTGSTVIDANNTSGFCAAGKACLVAIYTGHTPEHDGKPALQTQNIAYSNDRGRTWTKYKGNPVLDLHMADFRDPKVFWSDTAKRWVMVVALPNEHEVLLYHSTDLKKWRQVSEFGPAGATAGQWECPELFEVPVENSSGTQWVLKIGLNPGALQGGSGEQYFVGQFDGTRFTNSSPASETLWTDYGKDCYCALTFNGYPPKSTATAIGWMDNWQYAAELPTAPPWRGQMTVPRRLSLRRTAEGIRLVQRPVDAIKDLRRNPRVIEAPNLSLLNEALTLEKQRLSAAFEAELEFAGSGDQATVDIGIGESKTIIGYDRRRAVVFVDRTHSGRSDFSKEFPARTEAPLRLSSGSPLRLHILGDHNSLEVFADDGLVTLTNLVFPPAGKQRLQVRAEYGGFVAKVRMWDLEPDKH